MKIVFVVNKKNDRLAKVLPGLESYSHNANMGEVEFVFTQGPKHAVELAGQVTESNCDYLVAVGGDGTLHEVINGIMQTDVPASDYPVIGLLPYGSANDFARTAGVSNSIAALFELINSQSIQEIDLGKIVLQPSLEICYFINIAGIGLGPEVVQSLQGSSSVFGSGFNYFKHILKGFLRYKKKEVHCIASNWQWKGKLLQMAVANGCYYGNAIHTAPGAQLDDGKFQVAIFGDLSLWDYLKNMRNLKKGVKIDHPQVYYHAAEQVRLESNDLCGIEADGEYVGLLPATISVIPKAIRFIMPLRVQ
jgi:diacylglycerol kinase (ATP)